MILVDPFQLGMFSDAVTKGSEHLAAAVLFQQLSPAAVCASGDLAVPPVAGGPEPHFYPQNLAQGLRFNYC